MEQKIKKSIDKMHALILKLPIKHARVLLAELFTLAHDIAELIKERKK